MSGAEFRRRIRQRGEVKAEVAAYRLPSGDSEETLHDRRAFLHATVRKATSERLSGKCRRRCVLQIESVRRAA